MKSVPGYKCTPELGSYMAAGQAGKIGLTDWEGFDGEGRRVDFVGEPAADDIGKVVMTVCDWY